MPQDRTLYRQRKQKVLGYLRGNGGVATKEELQEATGAPLWAVNQMVNDCLYSSLNHNGRYVASKYTIGHRCDRKGFWTTEVDGEEIVFHRGGTSRGTLIQLARRTPWGITAQEAQQMLRRPCHRIGNKLCRDGSIQRAKLGDTWIYLHPWEKKRELQTKERITNPRVKPEKLNDEDETDEHIFADEILEDFQDFAQGKIESIPLSRLAMLLLMSLKDDRYRDVHARLNVSERVRNALGIEHNEIPHYSTLCRDFDRLDAQEQLHLMRELVRALMDDGVIHGKYLVVDGTHLLAWINTRNTVADGERENASWGEHEGSFYGYKLLILIDAEAELPVEIAVATGKRHESTMYIPLIRTFAEEQDVDVNAVFSDAAFDGEQLRKATRETLNCELLSAINPRRSTVKKRVKEWVKQTFKKHGDKIKNVKDALKLIPQRLLTSFGVKLGTDEESYIIHAIKERMNRHLRASVERVFSRMKQHLSLERPRVTPFEKVRKYIYLCIISVLSLAFSAQKRGKASCMRSFSKVI